MSSWDRSGGDAREIQVGGSGGLQARRAEEGLAGNRSFRNVNIEETFKASPLDRVMGGGGQRGLGSGQRW